jgi:hypothetical protein
MARQADSSLGVFSHRRTQTQKTRILDRMSRMSWIGCKDRFKGLCEGAPRDKISELILSLGTLHIGPDATHRDPSPCEGPLSDLVSVHSFY